MVKFMKVTNDAVPYITVGQLALDRKEGHEVC